MRQYWIMPNSHYWKNIPLKKLYNSLLMNILNQNNRMNLRFQFSNKQVSP